MSKLVIEAGKVNRQYRKDLLAYRELFLLLAWRDVLVRYKQTVIGVAWSVLRPLLIMVIFTIVFGRLAKMPSEGVPYPILVYAAMLPWQFFSNTVGERGWELPRQQREHDFQGVFSAHHRSDDRDDGQPD
jgi:lipopolysaccharide transport system permease protein